MPASPAGGVSWPRRAAEARGGLPPLLDMSLSGREPGLRPIPSGDSIVRMAFNIKPERQKGQ